MERYLEFAASKLLKVVLSVASGLRVESFASHVCSLITGSVEVAERTKGDQPEPFGSTAVLGHLRFFISWALGDDAITNTDEKSSAFLARDELTGNKNAARVLGLHQEDAVGNR